MKMRARLLPFMLLIPLAAFACGDDAATEIPSPTAEAGTTKVDASVPDSGQKDSAVADTSTTPPCAANQHVTAHACVACGAGSTNAAGDVPAGADTSCDATLCAADQRVQTHACVACTAGSTNAAGDDASGADTTCDGTALCAVNQRVVSHACVACPTGSTNAAGDNKTGADTTCDATLCAANTRVLANVCTACAAGSTNAAGDNATGANTTCDATLCAVNAHVVAHACVACGGGLVNAAGDDATGADTPCDALCPTNQRVVAHACVACPVGTSNVAGDDPVGADTTCDPILCAADTYVAANVCTACAPGTTNAAGDDATGADTTCDATLCAANQYVSAHACVACGAGSTNALGDDASGADTACDATLCAVNEYVAGNACVACAANSVNAAGDDATGADTACDLVDTDICATTNEGGTITLTCFGGAVINSLSFASYGTPTGMCGGFAVDNACNAGSSTNVVTAMCNKLTSCMVLANNATFGDPCVGVGKKLNVQAHCGLCGNGVLDGAEVCDDVYNDNLFCDSTCAVQPVVGTIRANCSQADNNREFIRGSACVDLVGGGPSWLSLPAGVHATVYDTAGCTGKTKSIVAAEQDFCTTNYDQGGGLNDTVRSIRIERN
jgi:hypothetical protein